MSFWVAYLTSSRLAGSYASCASARDSKSILQTLHGIRRASSHETPSLMSSVHMCVYGSCISGYVAGLVLGVGGSGSKEASLALVEDHLRELGEVDTALQRPLLVGGLGDDATALCARDCL